MSSQWKPRGGIWYNSAMSIKEIEAAINQLPVEEVTRLMSRLAERRPRDKTRLAQECAKLDPAEEQAMADVGLAAEAAQWPPY